MITHFFDVRKQQFKNKNKDEMYIYFIIAVRKRYMIYYMVIIFLENETFQCLEKSCRDNGTLS